MAGLAETHTLPPCMHTLLVEDTVYVYSGTITKVALPNMSCSNEDIKTAEIGEHLAMNHAMSYHAVVTCLYICISS